MTAPSIVLTGAMGAGKSTILAQLRQAGVACVPEPARLILAQQRAIAATGVPEKDPELFCRLMLSWALRDYQEHAGRAGTIFDRGLPDLVAYAQLFDLDTAPFLRAAELYRYSSPIFFFAGWEEIYATDDERKMDFKSASQFGDAVRLVYENLGYQVIEVPRVSAEERAAFILGRA